MRSFYGAHLFLSFRSDGADRNEKHGPHDKGHDRGCVFGNRHTEEDDHFYVGDIFAAFLLQAFFVEALQKIHHAEDNTPYEEGDAIDEDTVDEIIEAHNT